MNNARPEMDMPAFYAQVHGETDAQYAARMQRVVDGFNRAEVRQGKLSDGQARYRALCAAFAIND